MLANSKTKEPTLDPRVKRTRQMLVQALKDLILEKSFQDITVQDIAERATVNRVTFYAHFTDKFALMEYTMREMIREQLRKQVPESAHYSPETLTTLIVTICEFLTQVHTHCPPPHDQFETLMEKQIKAELNEVLKAWLLEAPTKAHNRAAPELAAMMATWAIYGAAVQWSLQEPRESVNDFARQVLPIITASLKAYVPG